MQKPAPVELHYPKVEATAPQAFYINAINLLSAAARHVLNDDLRPGVLQTRTIPYQRLVEDSRNFKLVVPQPAGMDPQGSTMLLTPACLRSQSGDPGYTGQITQSLSLELPKRGSTLTWVNGGHDVMCIRDGSDTTYLSLEGIYRVAGLIMSPLFLNYLPATDHLTPERMEFDLPLPYPDEEPLFMYGNIAEAIAACQGIAVFLAGAKPEEF
jgi:hypothetical protein